MTNMTPDELTALEEDKILPLSVRMNYLSRPKIAKEVAKLEQAVRELGAVYSKTLRLPMPFAETRGVVRVPDGTLNRLQDTMVAVSDETKQLIKELT